MCLPCELQKTVAASPKKAAATKSPKKAAPKRAPVAKATKKAAVGKSPKKVGILHEIVYFNFFITDSY